MVVEIGSCWHKRNLPSFEMMVRIGKRFHVASCAECPCNLTKQCMRNFMTNMVIPILRADPLRIDESRRHLEVVIGSG